MDKPHVPGTKCIAEFSHSVARLKRRIAELEQSLCARDREAAAMRMSMAELQQDNDMLRTMIDAAPTAIIGLDLEGRVHSVWNKAAEKMFGWCASEVMGRMLPTVPAEELAVFEALLERLHKGEAIEGEEVHRQRRDGSPITYSVHASPLRDRDGKIIGNIAIIVDVTERIQANAALCISEARFRTLVDNAPDGICVQAEGRFLFLNPAMVALFGAKSAEDLLGTDVMARVAPGHIQSVRDRIRLQSETKCILPPAEREYLRLDGVKVPVEVAAVPFSFQGRDAVLIFARNISARRKVEAEQERLREQLQKSQKMESVGRLAGGVAHDYNNMLSVIMGYADLALEKIGLEDPLHGDLVEIMNAAERSKNITRQLLAFARQQPIAPLVLDLNKTVESMLNMLRRLIGEDIDLIWLPGEGLWPVKMDSSQIDQILANLVVNARDAIGGVGKITIETHTATFGKAYCSDHAEHLPGDFVMLAVSDTGCGMDEKTVAKLFEPFFTTKAVGRGTGLGMATVYGILKQNKGFIDVYSEPGVGTTFKIYLPRHNRPADGGPWMTEEKIPESWGETILVVEDEPVTRKLIERILTTLGYKTLVAGSPSEAIRLVAARKESIALLLTDVIMPEMNGRQLSQRLCSLCPDMKILFMSGYTADVIAHHGVLDAGLCFIQKPFSRQELKSKVREALGG